MEFQSLFKGNLVHWTALDIEKDAGTISTWTNSCEFVRNHFEGFFRLYSVFEVKKQFKEKLQKADETKLEYYFAIHANADDKLVGLLHYVGINPTHHISPFTLDLPDDGNFEKYGSEALQMLMRYAFMELSLYRLWSVIASNNEIGIASFEKAGFLRETQRREAVFQNGKYYDALCYAILRPEWKQKYLEESI